MMNEKLNADKLLKSAILVGLGIALGATYLVHKDKNPTRTPAGTGIEQLLPYKIQKEEPKKFPSVYEEDYNISFLA